jgi:hypothetical protein
MKGICMRNKINNCKGGVVDLLQLESNTYIHCYYGGGNLKSIMFTYHDVMWCSL